MPVNTDEMLIFKMRGMKKKEVKKPEVREEVKKEAAAKPVPAAQSPVTEEAMPQEAPTPQPVPQPVPAPAPVEEQEEAVAVPVIEAQPAPTPAPREKPKREIRLPGLFAKREKAAKKPREKTLIETFQAPEAPQYVEEERMREVETLEQQAFEYVPEETEQERAAARAVLGPNPFTILAGTILIINAILFGYFIYPQAEFVLSYAAKIGFGTFITNLNFNYGFTFLNFLLVVFGALGGLLMFIGVRWSNMVSGAIGAVTLLSVTFEYLNSNAEYLLVVSVVAFVGIFALAYSRMSAVSVEKEETMPREVIWPKLETF